MSKGSLLRRLRRAERSTPLPAGVTLQDVFAGAARPSDRGPVEQETATFTVDPALVAPEVARKAVFRRLRALGKVMGKRLSDPRPATRIPQVEPEDPDPA